MERKMRLEEEKKDTGLLFLRMKPILWSDWNMYGDHLFRSIASFALTPYTSTAEGLFAYIENEKKKRIEMHVQSKVMKAMLLSRVKRGFRKSYSRLVYTGIVWFSDALEGKLRDLKKDEIQEIFLRATKKIADWKNTVPYATELHDVGDWVMSNELHEYILGENASQVKGMHFHFSIIGYALKVDDIWIPPISVNPYDLREMRRIFVRELREHGIKARDSGDVALEEPGVKIPEYIEEVKEEHQEKEKKRIRYWLGVREMKEGMDEEMEGEKDEY
ncbi:MAG: hypothetical protein JHC30_07225 [Caldisericum sp.]|jgi:hypothetical protein|nr:hypothetical protein [Caldisericum sp.]